MKFFQVLEIDCLTLKFVCFNLNVYLSDMVLTDKDLEKKKHGEKIFHGIFHPGYLVLRTFWSFLSFRSSGHCGQSCHLVILILRPFLSSRIWSFQSSGYSSHFGHSTRVRRFRLYIFFASKRIEANRDLFHLFTSIIIFSQLFAYFRI
jgi:hypothetical protein